MKMKNKEILECINDGTYISKFDRDGNFLGYWDGYNKNTLIEKW